MKKSHLIAAGVILFSLTFQGCQEDNSPEQDSQIIQKEVIAGSWKITLFEDSGKNETSYFTGYVFQFTDLGVINASKGGTTVSGIWSIDSSDDDDSPSDLDFNIFFNLTNEFEELNDDWEIKSHSATKIELIDISGGDGDIDYLTFEKN